MPRLVPVWMKPVCTGSQYKTMIQICPTHNIPLVTSQTKYGPRHSCPREGCTVVLWGKSLTATPADEETRRLRHRCHIAFDPIWKSGRIKRSTLYQELSEYLELSREETHIGKFDKAKCFEVLRFCQQPRYQGKILRHGRENRHGK